jgi:hypothetical protein
VGGAADGSAVGRDVGIRVGARVGAEVGAAVGVVGALVGDVVAGQNAKILAPVPISAPRRRPGETGTDSEHSPLDDGAKLAHPQMAAQ